jgi:hypothetical protein
MEPKLQPNVHKTPNNILNVILKSCASFFTILFYSILAFMPTRHLESLLFKLPNYIYACYMSTFISGFRRDVNEICVLPGFYLAYSDNSAPIFRNNLPVPFLRVKKSKKKAGST